MYNTTHNKPHHNRKHQHPAYHSPKDKHIYALVTFSRPLACIFGDIPFSRRWDMVRYSWI